jgi:hypothetical protein
MNKVVTVGLDIANGDYHTAWLARWVLTPQLPSCPLPPETVAKFRRRLLAKVRDPARQASPAPVWFVSVLRPRRSSTSSPGCWV